MTNAPYRDVWIDGTAVDKSAIRNLYRDRGVIRAGVAEIQAMTTLGHAVFLVSIGGAAVVFEYDPTDVSSADDNGTSVIVSLSGQRYKRRTSSGGAAGPGYGGTSTTNIAIGTGTKTFTVDTGLAYVVGSRARLVNSATRFIEGVVTAYNSGTGVMTINADLVGGSGSYTAWSLTLAGTPGADGAPGAPGVDGAPGTNGTNGTNGAGYGGTSTSTVVIGTGAKSFATQAGLAYIVGSRVRVASSAAPSTFVEGVVTDYTATTLTLSVDRTGGSGSLSSWNISLAGEPGINGAGAGDVVGPATSIDARVAVFSGTTGKLLADGGQTVAQIVAAASADAVAAVRNGVAAAFDTLAEIATELGNKITKVTGTAGLLKTAADGTASVATAGTDYVSPAVAYNMTKGGTFAPNSLGTVSTGTIAPAPADGNYQYYTNNGAHTLAAPASDCEIAVLITNGATAGSVTFSGFTSSTGVGDALTTTNGHRFRIIITRINAVSTYYVKAYQ